MDREPDFATSSARHRAVRQNAGSSVLGGVILLICGIYLYRAGLQGISKSAIFNWSIAAVVWTLLIGGIGELAGSALCWTGWRPALLIDALINLAIGAALLSIGAIWITHSDFQGLLLIVFSLFSFSGLRGSWQAWRATAATGLEQPSAPIPEPTGQTTPVPAAEPSSPPARTTKPLTPKTPPPATASTPADETPPEGFLAELGRDDESSTHGRQADKQPHNPDNLENLANP